MAGMPRRRNRRRRNGVSYDVDASIDVYGDEPRDVQIHELAEGLLDYVDDAYYDEDAQRVRIRGAYKTMYARIRDAKDEMSGRLIDAFDLDGEDQLRLTLHEVD